MSSNESTLLVTEGQYVAKLVISTAQSKFTIDSIFSLLGEYALIFFTILVVRAWVMQYFSFQKEEALAKRHGCQLPTILKTAWPLGIDRIFQVFEAANDKRVLHFLYNLINDTGDTLCWKVLGSRVWGTQDPKNIEAMLTTHAHDFGHEVRREVVGSLLGDGIFTQDGAAWKRSRDLLRPQLFRKRFEDLTIFEHHVDNLIKCIPARGVVDLQPLFLRMTMDTATAFLFGKSVDSLSPDQAEDAEKFTDAFQYAQEYVKQRYQLGRLCWLMNGRKYKEACRTVHEFVDKFALEAIEEHQCRKLEPDESEPSSLLKNLVRQSQDPLELRAQLLHLLVAGRESLAAFLSWTLRLISIQPDVLQRLREEIDSVLGSGPGSQQITYKNLKEMKYLSCVLKEVLRLYPPIPINSRTAMKPLALPVGGGPDGQSPILIRKGEDVIYSLYSMHRRTDLYGSDAETFRPERWENKQLNNVENSFGYLPFHGGPRVCPGQDLALTEASYTVVRLLQSFSTIRCDSGMKHEKIGLEKQNLGFVVLSADGCNVEMRV